MGGLGLVNLKTHVLPSLAHWIGRLTEDTDKTHILNVRAVLNLREVQPPGNPELPKFHWPMALKRRFLEDPNFCRVQSDPLPYRWKRFRAAFNTLAKYKSERNELTPGLIADLCDSTYGDVRVPVHLHSVFDVQLPKQIETVGIFSMSFQKRISHDINTHVCPSWEDRHFSEEGDQAPTSQEWKRLWKRIATLPLSFAHLQQAWYFVTYRAHFSGTKAWTFNAQQPNNTALCTLCGQGEETYKHLLSECCVSRGIWRKCIDAESYPPSSLADIVCPKQRWNKFTKEDLKMVLFVGTVSKLARSRRARREVVLMPVAESELRPYVAKLKSCMRLGLTIVMARERAETAKLAAQIAANARAEAVLAVVAEANAEAPLEADADAEADGQAGAQAL